MFGKENPHKKNWKGDEQSPYLWVSKRTSHIFLLPVEPDGNSLGLPIGVTLDT